MSVHVRNLIIQIEKESEKVKKATSVSDRFNLSIVRRIMIRRAIFDLVGEHSHDKEVNPNRAKSKDL